MNARVSELYREVMQKGPERVQVAPAAAQVEEREEAGPFGTEIDSTICRIMEF